MDIDGSMHYGNEWISEDQSYFKFNIVSDGVYRISMADAQNAGIPIASINGSQLAIYNYGKQVAVYVSSTESLSSEDYILFYAEKNRGYVDQYLYHDPIKDQLNSDYSLYTDQNAYYLTWNQNEDNLRIKERPNNYDPDNPLTKERFYQHTEKKVFSDLHFKPTHNGRDFIRYSSYDIGEGYGSKVQKQRFVDFDLDKIYAQGTRPKVHARFTGTASNHFIETKINDLILNKFSSNGYGVNDFEFTFNHEHLSEKLQVEIVGKKSNNDRHCLSSISVTYPREYDFRGQSSFSFELTPSFIPRLLEIENFKHGGQAPMLIDKASGEIFYPIIENEIVKVEIPSSASDRQLLLINPDLEIKGINQIEKTINPINVQGIGDFLIISNEALYKDESNADWVRAYADYRASDQGGSYQPSIIDVNELYEQFSYGIQGHSIAIKNFVNHLIDEGKDIKAIFIIGKGLEYPLLRKKSSLNDVQCFVPTYGSPGGDNLFSAIGTDHLSHIPVGRLAAQSPEEIKAYLEKVKAFEMPVDFADDESLLWRKKVLHLSGGSADIQELLFGYLTDMERVIENNQFGADVFTFRKTTADLIQSSQTDEIISRINSGASLITFFGHAAVGTFDFSLEDPSRYDNEGKTPIILSLGCHSGNVHSEGIGLSEDFVLEESKGAVAFIASSGTAYINPQFHSGMNFYKSAGEDIADKGIGEVIKKSLTEISATENIETITLAQQLTIHGDPVLKLFKSHGPDYAVDYNGLGVSPAIVNTTLDSFDFNFTIINRGSYRDEPLNINIQLRGSDGEIYSEQIVTVAAPAFSEDYTITLENPGVESVGRNDIFITIDPNNETLEYPTVIAESNNEIIHPLGEESSYNFFILDNKAKPIYPSEFGILNDDVITVHATSDNGLMPLSNYILEIDTTERFNSDLLTTAEVSSINSVITWSPDITHIDGVVYYWRLSPNNLENNERKWEGSSFLYAPRERDGWNQSHFYQWDKNNYDQLLLDTTSRQLVFGKRTWDIRVKNELLDPQDFWVFVNGTPWSSLNAKQIAPALSVFIWHPRDILFKNRGRDFGSIQYSPDAFLYKMNSPADRKNVSNLLNGAPDGSRIFIHTILRDENSTLHIEDWANDKETIGLDLFEVMEGFGAKKFGELKEKGTVPYTFIFDKGTGPVAEDIANNVFETVDLSSIGKTFWDYGQMNASAIGPVKRFMRLEWEEEKTITDATSLHIVGVRDDGRIDTLRTIQNDYDVNLTFIRPDEYPQIYLAYEAEDSSDKSAAQLNWWRVLYQDLPDVSFDIEQVAPFIPDTIESGTPFGLSFGIRNLSEEEIDPFRIKYLITGADNQEYVFYNEGVVLSGDELKFIDFEMTEILAEGEYKISVLLNDQENPSERTFDNNIGILQFYVKGDKREPILEVKANGDFISENANLPVTSEFEVSFSTPALKILLEDRNIFNISLTYPSGRVIKLEDYKFSPSAEVDNNLALAAFTPTLDEEGKYTLNVEVTDGSRKAYEDQHYEVSFYVSGKSQISDANIYPNPMTSYTQIDITVEGGEVPVDFSIRIFDIDGRLVSTIDRNAFHNIKTGPFTRSHLWRAKDSEGAELPSGTYVVNISGQKVSEKTQLNRKIVVVR